MRRPSYFTLYKLCPCTESIDYGQRRFQEDETCCCDMGRSTPQGSGALSADIYSAIARRAAAYNTSFHDIFRQLAAFRDEVAFCLSIANIITVRYRGASHDEVHIHTGLTFSALSRGYFFWIGARCLLKPWMHTCKVELSNTVSRAFCRDYIHRRCVQKGTLPAMMM